MQKATNKYQTDLAIGCYIRIVIFERKGSPNAFFAWQQVPHMYAQIFAYGVPLSPKHHILSQHDLDNITLSASLMQEAVD